MKVLTVARSGAEPAFEIVDQPVPEPGRGQVRVTMKAVALNFRDLLMVRGLYAPGKPTPFVPFSDGCGVIDAVGEGVGIRPGTRVAPLFFQGWAEGPPTLDKVRTSLAHPLGGVAAGSIVLDEAGVVPVPDHLSDEEVATLPCAALTAWRAMFCDARLTPGRVVLLQGTGGVSLFGLQFAKAAGLTVIITSSSDAKLERARSLGADHGINYRTSPDWAAEARRLTGGDGVDFIMEVGGGETLRHSLKAVRMGGHIAVMGVLSGAAIKADVGLFNASGARVQGVAVGSREMFVDMNRAIVAHRLRPVVSQVFELNDVATAIAAMSQGSHFGKIVMRMPRP
jgi:NADPH:quinone reductase-like Zn-dependent oxidoreductase